MALATKCPHCNTIFRVAADQLKLRGGIVRCGACNEVFDGNAALVEPAARPTPVIPEVVIAPSPSSPASNYVQGTPVDFDLDALDAAAPAGDAAAERTQEPEPAEESSPPAAAPAVWRTAAFKTPVQAPAHEPMSDTQDDAAAHAEADANADADAYVDAETDAEAGAGADAHSDAHADADAGADADVLDAGADADDEVDAEFSPALERASELALEGPPDAEPELLASSAEESELEGASDEPAPRSAELQSELEHDDAYALNEHEQPEAPADAHGRIEPNFDTPQEHIVAVALDDLHHFDDLEAEPTSEELEQAALEELHHLGEEPHDDTALHAIAAVNTDAPDDGPSLRAEGDEDLPPAEPVLHFVPDPKTEMAARMRALAGVDESESAALDHEELGFDKRANRSERYGRAANITLAVGTPLLLVALLLQGATTFRNTLAADYPSLKPALATGCAELGCQIELPAQLDMLSIEQGELQTVADNTSCFSTVLRNQARTAQAWPHLELILNDSADKPVLRRVFAPREYLASQADVDKGFTPRSEQTVKLYFELSQLKASGYHIAIFYP
jgi:predicted Zn finger-like uncharacterized protein